MLTSYSDFPIITKPTRITDTTANVIDHIITNDTNHLVLPGIMQTDTISDHYTIFWCINNMQLPKKPNEHPINYYRDKKF